MAPTITTPPVLTWDVQVGTSPSITPPVYTGSPGTITYTLKRAGVAVTGLTGVSEATIEAHVGVGVTGTDARDIGPGIIVTATVTNGAGSDSEDSNSVTFSHATHLPDTGIGVSTAGLTLADSNTTVDQWAATLGGQTALMGPVASPAATNRPAYSATGGVGSRTLVTADGTDNVLTKTVTKGSTWTGYEFGNVGAVVSSGTSQDFLQTQNGVAPERRRMVESATATNVDARGDNNAGTLQTSAGTSAESAVTHRSMDWTFGANQNMRVNGTIESGVAQDRTAYADGVAHTIAGNVAGGSACNLAIQAWHYSTRQLTSAERLHLRSLLTFHTGIAC